AKPGFNNRLCNVVVHKVTVPSGINEIDTIVFADAGWDSILVHNYIAQTIIEAGFGYDTETTTGSSSITFQGLIEEDIHVYMEVWTQNIEPAYENAIEAGEIVELS